MITQAHQLARPIKPSDSCSAGSVGSAIISRSAKTYTGICLDFDSSLGFCAEHAAIAEMLKAHEAEISLVVAVDELGAVLPPCGRCREMMRQLDPANKNALVILSADRALPLGDFIAIQMKRAPTSRLGLPCRKWRSKVSGKAVACLPLFLTCKVIVVEQ